MIVVGSHWETGPWRQTPREVVIEDVLDGHDEVAFKFVDTGASSSATTTAFLRTYREIPT